jgi:hypothetical protein
VPRGFLKSRVPPDDGNDDGFLEVANRNRPCVLISPFGNLLVAWNAIKGSSLGTLGE